MADKGLCHSFKYRMNCFGIKTVYSLPEVSDAPGAASDQGEQKTEYHFPCYR